MVELASARGGGSDQICARIKGISARSAGPDKKGAPKRGPEVEEGSGTQRNATEFDVGWWKSPSRQGLGGWVKLPVEDCSTNRQ